MKEVLKDSRERERERGESSKKTDIGGREEIDEFDKEDDFQGITDIHNINMNEDLKDGNK